MDSKRLTILVYSVLAVFGIIVVFACFRMFEKKNSSDIKDDPYTPNDVKVDSFTYSFLKLEAKNKNFIYSPISIKYALSMLKEGANGNTYDEINKLIGDLPLTKYENIDKVLSLANSVFIRDRYKKYVLDSYIKTLKDNYSAEVIYDKFKDATNVNNWIANKTFNIIQNMLSDSYFENDNLEMILINALAIDMEWQVQFEGSNTHGATFTKENGEEVQAAMMYNETEYFYKYYQDDNYSAVSMPLKNYSGTELEFIAILPEKTDLKTFITSDDFDSKLESILNSISKFNGKIAVSIPRFEYNYSIKLTDELKTLGINDAFTLKADFSKMSKSELYVGDVLHKADIKFSEEGIKAAAATVILMVDKSLYYFLLQIL